MSNRVHLFLNQIDKYLLQFSPPQIRQIMEDYSNFEITGTQGDTFLNKVAGEAYRHFHRLDKGFDSSYLRLIGTSAHKISNIRQMKENDDLEAADRNYEAQALARDLASLGDLTGSDASEALRNLRERAREIMGLGPDVDVTPAP